MNLFGTLDEWWISEFKVVLWSFIVIWLNNAEIWVPFISQISNGIYSL